MTDYHHPPRAKRMIYLFMSGGPSQMDLWDDKPVLRERAAKPEFGFGNVQDFYFTGPVSFVVAVSVDPKATRADLIAEMAFRDFDWKLVRLVPAR